MAVADVGCGCPKTTFVVATEAAVARMTVGDLCSTKAGLDLFLTPEMPHDPGKYPA